MYPQFSREFINYPMYKSDWNQLIHLRINEYIELYEQERFSQGCLDIYPIP